MQRPMLQAITITLAVVASAATWAQPEAQQQRARNLAATCTGCHGTGGASSAGMPRLAGMPRDQLKRSLQEFKSGARPGSVMPQLAKGYTDAQIDAIAAWFEAQSARY